MQGKKTLSGHLYISIHHTVHYYVIAIHLFEPRMTLLVKAGSKKQA